MEQEIKSTSFNLVAHEHEGKAACCNYEADFRYTIGDQDEKEFGLCSQCLVDFLVENKYMIVSSDFIYRLVKEMKELKDELDEDKDAVKLFIVKKQYEIINELFLHDHSEKFMDKIRNKKKKLRLEKAIRRGEDENTNIDE